MKIGAQFYTLREFCKDKTGFAEALKRVAAIGYKAVQISGVCSFSAAWLKEELDKNGLECVLTHTPAERLLNATNEVAEEHSIFNCKYIGLGHCGFDGESEDICEDFVKLYKPVAKAFKENGKYFMYHNHAHEFKKISGKTIMEMLAESFAADEMGFTLDTFWVQAGGGDPAQWLERLKGRVPCIHIKDFAYDRKMAVIGEGNLNFERIFEKAENAGTEYMLVEQDDCYGENPFECLERSYKYLRSRGFE